MKIIGLVAYDRCGKDTFAEELKELIESSGYKTHIIRLADPLKKLVSKMLNIPEDMLEKFKNDNILLGWGLNIEATRDVIIDVATACRQVFGEAVFIDAFENELVRRDIDVDDYIIIPDVRFIKEAEMIKSYDGLIIKLDSELPDCGKNDKKYEVDSIPYDIIVKIEKDKRPNLNPDLVKRIASLGG